MPVSRVDGGRPGRLQLLKQKHSRGQGEQWGEPAEMEASPVWLQEKHLELGGPGWAPAHDAHVTLGPLCLSGSVLFA